jgi:hypothetical protein
VALRTQNIQQIERIVDRSIRYLSAIFRCVAAFAKTDVNTSYFWDGANPVRFLRGVPPPVPGLASPAMEAALAERTAALDTRAGDPLRQAVADRAPCLTAIGPVEGS